MSLVQQAGVTTRQYAYNGRGEQVRRYLGNTNTYTVYDEAGHWLGDYDDTGAPVQQALWMDDLPVGLLANGHQLHYVQPDHLGSPRVVIEAARNVPVWTWDLKGEAFGSTAPQQDPDGDGIPFVLDMRFPGQRYDAASALNQNYFRDYEPAIGRYVQSDPIGLSGGVGTYAYVGSNPIDFIDMLGLTKEDIDCMYALAKELEKDLKFPRKDPLTRDFGPPDENGMVTRGMWNPLTRQLYVSDIYLQHLSHAQLEDLYDTLVHEVLHPNRGLKGASKAGHTALAEEANRRTKLANPTDRCGCGR